MKRIILFLTMSMLLGCTTLVATGTDPADKTIMTAVTSKVTSEPISSTVTTQCLKIQQEVPPDIMSKGILFLDSWVDDGTGKVRPDTFTLNMETMEKTLISGTSGNLIDFSVSPDQKRIAYSDGLVDANANWLVNDLIIATADNQILQRIPIEEDWGYIRWLDNDRLIIRQADDKVTDPVERSSTFLVLDLQTGEREILKPEFPGIYDIPPVPDWDGWGETAYNPSIDQVVYLKEDEDGRLYYVFWDLAENKEIADFPVAEEIDAVPRWAPDGQHFAFTPSLFFPSMQWPRDEFYDVTRDGRIIQLTHLADSYPWVYIADFSWSPDGNLIAFWFSYWLDKEIDRYGRTVQYLAILDTNTGKVINYCVPGEINATIGSRRIPPPLWSPNGQQIVVQSQTSQDSFDAIMVDIPSGQAIFLGKDLEPVGWMTFP